MPTAAEAPKKTVHPFFAGKHERLKLQAEVQQPKKQLDVTVDEHHPPEDKPKARAPRKKKEATSTTSVTKKEPASTAKPKAKSKLKKPTGDHDDAFRGRISGSSETRATRTSARQTLGKEQEPITITSENEAEIVEPEIAEAIDPNADRRKRRKKSPGEEGGSQQSQGGGSDSDTEMREAEEPEAPTAAAATDKKTITIATKEPEASRVELSESIPTKPTHWFFGGKPKKPDPPPVSEKPSTLELPPSQAKERKRFFKTKEELDAEASAGLPHVAPLSPATSKVLKIPGLLEAPWPNREQVHVRGLDEEEDSGMEVETSIPFKRSRKMKSTASGVSTEEDLITQQLKRLSIPQQIQAINQPDYYEEEYFSVSPNIQLPELRFLTGLEIQKEIRKRLSASVPPPGRTPSHCTARLIRADSDSSLSSSSETEKPSLIVALPSARQAIIPILRLYTSLFTTLTPHDLGRSEVHLWTSKYAPEDSSSILQVRRETSLLRNWLASLRVEATENMEQATKRHKREKEAKKKPKKKRKRNTGLDDLADFLADDDLLEDITDPDDDILYGTPSGLDAYSHPLTAAANGRGFPMLGGSKPKAPTTSSAILITGPHGCGKTASVYAVAKELGYTVFEINPGTRRSGKDILDQVGQMSKNHLVHQSKDPASSFFSKPKVPTMNADSEAEGKRAQQQSLILLEEVDILFASDQHFWTTVLSLLSTSKRPIVMTATNLELVPTDTLPLHTTLHFQSPDLETAADYLLLLAANEGHILTREAVETVYKANGEDLRQSIMELQFWCQMAVGDRRAGLGWYPPVSQNKDKAPGHILRPVSVDTIRPGLGMVYGPELYDGVGIPEEEVACGVWNEYEVEILGESSGISRGQSDFVSSIHLSEYSSPSLLSEEEKYKKVQALDAFLTYAEALSDSTCFQGETFIQASLTDTPLDPTAPKRAHQEPDDLIGDPYLKATPLVTPQTPLKQLLVATTRSLAIRTLKSATANLAVTGLYPTLDNKEILRRVLNESKDSYPMLKYADNVIRTHLTPLFEARPLETFSASTIATSFSPYIRRVIRHDDTVLEKKNSLLSTGGRKTRAARSALLGEAGLGHRGRRGERWWNVSSPIRWDEILSTGGEGWGDIEGRALAEASERAEQEHEQREEHERLEKARVEMEVAGEVGEGKSEVAMRVEV